MRQNLCWEGSSKPHFVDMEETLAGWIRERRLGAGFIGFLKGVKTVPILIPGYPKSLITTCFSAMADRCKRLPLVVFKEKEVPTKLKEIPVVFIENGWMIPSPLRYGLIRCVVFFHFIPTFLVGMFFYTSFAIDVKKRT
ncbi:hypothetical protein HZS_2682 [Henneguya salminicola]|nr:hypothetical protein HZS_2682 [Henneguya salminicola]